MFDVGEILSIPAPKNTVKVSMRFVQSQYKAFTRVGVQNFVLNQNE
jgi:hypothetical protein